MKRIIFFSILVVVFFVWNFGFSLSFCQAAGPFDPWSMSIFMQQSNPGSFSYGGSPTYGTGFNNYGLYYFNPNSGPSMPQTSWGWSAPMSYYNPRDYLGPGNDGLAYGYWPNQDYYRPGSSTMLGIYGSGAWYVPNN